MKRMIVLFVALTLSLQFLVAQEDTTRVGTKAFIFSFTGSTLEDFGLKYWMTEYLSITGAFTFSFESAEKSNLQNRPESKGEQYSFEIGIQYSLLTHQDLLVYSRGTIGYSLGHFKTEYSPLSASFSETTNRSRSFILGVGVGIEYWVIKRLSLSGQHTFHALFQKYVEQQDSFPEDAWSRQTYNLGESRLVLSLYF